MDINNLWSGYDLNSKKQNTRCLAVNTILEGKYLVGPVLGQGGFGITYVGYDLNMEAKIAIKEYFPVELVSRDTTTMHGDRVLSLSGEKSVTYKAGLKKYVAEAQNVSQFSEIPGVVSVKDFFYANETAYIVMEFIDGISLKDYLKEKGGRLTEEETLAIMKPVLEALVQVHKFGIIHRDISPDNIMLTFEGSGHGKIKSVKLIDFGAARMTAKNDQKSLTIILKHGYAPEEQYRTHGEQGPWTDVYALCAVLYRMLTGETPVPAMDRMFQDELKTFDKFNTKVSANTAAAILKGLAVKKDDRIQSVQDLIAALYEGVKVKTVAGTRKSGKSKMGLFAGIGVAALAAVIGVSVLGKSGKMEFPVATAVQETSGISGNVNEGEKESRSQSAAETASQTEAVMDLTVEEEILGEQIVFYNPQRSISSPLYGHILFGMPDGTVKAIGNNSDGACDVEDWDHVAAVSTGDGCSFGIRTDGTVLYAKDIFAPDFGWDEVEYWTDILDIRCGLEYVLGLKKDGTILVSGNTEEAEELRTEIAEWKNIKAIECVRDSVYGLTEEGEVLFAGRGKPEAEITITDWDSANYIIQPHDPINFLCGIFDDGSVKRMNLSTGEIREEEGFYRYYDGLLGVREDGTIAYNDLAQCCFDVQDETIVEEINSWTDMQAAVFNQYNTAVGFKTDGTPMILSGNQGNVQLADMKNLKWIQAVPGSESANLLTCTNDGKILTYGPRMSEAEDAGIYAEGDNVKWYNEAALLLQDGTLKILRHEDGVQTFRGVKQVYEISNGWYNYQYFCYYIFLLEDGTVQLYKSGSFEPIEEQIDPILKGLETWTDIVQIESDAGYATVGLKEDGSVFMCCEEGPNVEISSGEEKVTKLCSNTMGTLIGVTENGHVKWFINTNDSENSGMLQFENWENIVDVAMGEYHTVGLRADGTVAATGNNSWGQCDVEEWTDIVSIIADRGYTIGINKAGDMLIAGLLY